jgi:small subunit ribosomal protein S17
MAERGRRKVLIGTVISDKMEKTVSVSVERRVKHPVYQKFVRKMVKLKAHDENNQGRVGDRVRIIETRPLSKQKRWRVQEVLEKGVRD